MLLTLLLYDYATGVFSSRRIEQATWARVPVRMISGDTQPCWPKRNKRTARR